MIYTSTPAPFPSVVSYHHMPISDTFFTYWIVLCTACTFAHFNSNFSFTENLELQLCMQMVGTSTRLPAIQRLVEIKAVAEQLHFKISTLLLHGGKIMEAVTWFHQHNASYRKLTGAPEVIFLHWEWMSKQFLVFAELLETSSAAIQSAPTLVLSTAGGPLTEWEFYPAYYYQVSTRFTSMMFCTIFKVNMDLL